MEVSDEDDNEDDGDPYLLPITHEVSLQRASALALACAIKRTYCSCGYATFVRPKRTHCASLLVLLLGPSSESRSNLFTFVHLAARNARQS